MLQIKCLLRHHVEVTWHFGLFILVLDKDKLDTDLIIDLGVEEWYAVGDSVVFALDQRLHVGVI